MGGLRIKADRVMGAKGDFALLLCTLALAGTGLATLFSASAGYAVRLGRDPASFFLKQAVYALPALLAFLFCARCSLATIERGIKPLILFSLAFLALPFVPGIGLTLNGATRWIAIGPLTFQPSELFKYALIVYLAFILSKKADRIDDVVNSAIPPLIVTLLGCLGVYAQNDLSTAAVIGVAGLVMFWIAEIPFVFFVALLTVTVPLVALTVLTSDFRMLRVISYLIPGFEPYAQGYQVMAATRAVRAGGLMGEGFGLGVLKNGSIPEVQSDFIFAAFSEELGLLGVVFFLALWGCFAWRGYRIAFREENRFKSYLAFGLTSVLLLQTLVNMAVVVGLIPATGIALPFFSAGGSSLLVSAGACGLLYNISRERGRDPRMSNAEAEVVHGV